MPLLQHLRNVSGGGRSPPPHSSTFDSRKKRGEGEKFFPPPPGGADHRSPFLGLNDQCGTGKDWGGDDRLVWVMVRSQRDRRTKRKIFLDSPLVINRTNFKPEYFFNAVTSQYLCSTGSDVEMKMCNILEELELTFRAKQYHKYDTNSAHTSSSQGKFISECQGLPCTPNFISSPLMHNMHGKDWS